MKPNYPRFIWKFVPITFLQSLEISVKDPTITARKHGGPLSLIGNSHSVKSGRWWFLVNELLSEKTRRKYGAKNSFFFNRQHSPTSQSKNARNAIRPSPFLNNSRAILSRKLRSLDRLRPNEIFTWKSGETNATYQFNALKAQFKARLNHRLGLVESYLFNYSQGFLKREEV